MTDWPVFKSHDEARCFHCERLLDRVTAHPSHFPTGAWEKKCDDCKLYTFYDIVARGDE